MQYYSTNRQSQPVSFNTATLLGQAPDKGLYFPEKIPAFSPELLADWQKLDKNDLALAIMQPYVGNAIPQSILRQIVNETINFDFPLIPITNDIYALELFHGPTLAFKDVGARFMSRCLGYFNREQTQKVTVLVATSGDTGGAVANGFEGVEGVEVIILYPSGKVSPVQELQLTTCANNVIALEVKGSFDDCQAMVKDAFLDADLKNRYLLTSANSINVARWLPQQLYYAFALQQWPHPTPPIISVPSGNFGNICAGMMAWKSGMPVGRFIAACNANDVVPRYLAGQSYTPTQARPTLSNAMDVGNPSNFVRVMEIFMGQKAKLTDMLHSVAVSDADTLQTIKDVYNKTGYLLDPHGAVGYKALADYLEQHSGQKGMVLETAHPVKFPDVVEQAIGQQPPMPPAIQPLFERKKKSLLMDPGFENLKEWLLSRPN